MSIFSFFVILSAFANLGTIPGIFSIITLVLIFWGVISIDLFKPIDPDMLSNVVSNNQATKTCDLKGNTSTSNKHGFLYNLVFPQKGGSRIIHELKKIGTDLGSGFGALHCQNGQGGMAGIIVPANILLLSI